MILGILKNIFGRIWAAWGALVFVFDHAYFSDSIFPVYLFPGRAHENKPIYSIFKDLDGCFSGSGRLSA